MARASPAITAFFDALGDRRHGLEIAIGGDREAGLDDIDAHRVEDFGNLQLFFERHGRAGALLAVAQRGVEDIDAVGIGIGWLVIGLLVPIYRPPARNPWMQQVMAGHVFVVRRFGAIP